jgi:hypothetical protein
LDPNCKETYGTTKQQGSETQTPHRVSQTQEGRGQGEEIRDLNFGSIDCATRPFPGGFLLPRRENPS